MERGEVATGGAVRAAAAVLMMMVLLGGCGHGRYLMDTPRIYLNQEGSPWEGIDPSLQTDEVTVVYFTDREPEGEGEVGPEYGFGRSHSLAVGRAVVSIGKGMRWEELEHESTLAERDRKIPLKIERVEELMRFPETPYRRVAVDGGLEFDPAVIERHNAAVAVLCEAAGERLARTEAKDVYLFVHGYNNAFEDPIYVGAQVWHFLGRRGLPIVYTWPAGRGGPLRGYTYDRESSEFTVYHLRQTIEAVAQIPGLERLHIISHSRGTNIAVDAVRELTVLALAAGEDPAEKYKIHNIMLLAPDMDVDVLQQRVGTSNIATHYHRTTMYVSSHDKALGIAGWLFGSKRRLGRLRYDQMGDEEKHLLALLGRKGGIVQFELSAGSWGHNYFYTHPGASADLVSILRYDRDCGAENGRPLVPIGPGFWGLEKDYMLPKEAGAASAAPAGE